MSILWLDFETRSECDLPARGSYNYARHESTRVLCMAWALDDGDVEIWTPDQKFPKSVVDAVQAGAMIYAHNAAFERLIFWHVLGLHFDLEQFYCTAAQSRANCAPDKLEDVGRFASADMRKDHKGKALIKKCCCPPFRHTEQDLLDLYDYCAQDVRAMRAISKAMRPLSKQELADYHVNERINDRGVRVDVELAAAAQWYSEQEVAELQARVAEVTHGEVPTVRSPRLRTWVAERLGPEARKLMIVRRGEEDKESIDKSVRANLLALAEEDPDEVSADVAEVIQCADDLWASAVAKFSRLRDLASPLDDRVRGAFVFAGGSATGRYSSYGAQVHNFPRKAAKDPAAVRDAMLRRHSLVPKHGPRVNDVLKQMLRPALIPAPGRVFIVADWSAIEGRVHPWLANSLAGERKLQVFREGLDPYKVNAAATFHCTYEQVTDEQRQVGKVQELACFGRETRVLTSNGAKAIVEVTTEDLLWDGQEWVAHQGVIAKGRRQTIDVFGTEVTPDHLIRTQATWTQAGQLVSNKQFQIQALEVGLASLRCLAWSEFGKVLRGLGTQESSAIAARRRIWSMFTIFLGARLRAAQRARGSRQGFGARSSINTLRRAPTMLTAGGCSIGYPPRKIVATTPKIAVMRTMVGAVSNYTSLGAATKRLSSGTSSLWTDGISRIWSLTASTLTATTRPAISDSYQDKSIAPTKEKFSRCRSTSSNWRPVFDILNSGPRNRFTILTSQGPLVVHNCGFLGGVGSFQTFSRVYGVKFTVQEMQNAVEGWRRANPWAHAHGRELEQGYYTAMRCRGHAIKAARIAYLFDGVHLWYQLPSGRVLCYPYARVDDDGSISYAKAAWKPKSDAKEWPRGRLWPGLACENVTQATANDILRTSLRVLPECVLHVHDEIVLEVLESAADAAAARLREVMCTPPAWAGELPLNCEVKIMRVYGK